jgi:tRNA threonylcarbamoyladenosine biosynthesis protein TsaB
MKILAVDTATKSCSAAVLYKDSLLAEMTLVSSQTHSIHLMEMIETVIANAGLTVSDLDGFAATRGPGSFTGLRIGISSLKGLAAASGKPLVGVSTLDALAYQFSWSSFLICPFLDARKGEVYFSRCRFENGMLKQEIEEQVSNPANAIEGIDEPCVFAGEGALTYKELILDKMGELARFALPAQNSIKALNVGLLAMERFEKNDTEGVADFVPKYIRKSDAELKILRN